jgi:tRNA threonylcarbamoyladenosine biosynthesis protein TsaB
MLLAIDTATRTASVALFDQTGVIGEATWRAHENHTTSLMPQIVQLMRASGVQMSNVRAVGVATGPGSFTGLRIGLSAAKGLAFGMGLPLVGIPTLDALAHAFSHVQSFMRRTLPIWAIVQAGRGRYSAARYFVRHSRAAREGDYLVGDAEYLAGQIAASSEDLAASKNSRGSSHTVRRAWVCGEVDENLKSTLLVRLNERVLIASPSANVRRAAYLAELAWARYQTNNVDSVETLAPYYIPTTSLPQTESK